MKVLSWESVGTHAMCSHAVLYMQGVHVHVHMSVHSMPSP